MAAPKGNQYAKNHRGDKGGRKSVYKPAYVKQARKLAELGATDREIAEFFGVTEATLYRWKHTHEDLCEALKVGKDATDARVEQSLYRRAVGYSFDTVKIMQNAGEPVLQKYVEHVPPDTTACIFWLKNRKRVEWRDRPDAESAEGEAAQPVSVIVEVRDARRADADA